MQPRVRQAQALARLRVHLVNIGQIPIITIMLQGAEAVAAGGSVRHKTGPRTGNRHLVPKLVHLGAGEKCSWRVMRHHLALGILGQGLSLGRRAEPWPLLSH